MKEISKEKIEEGLREAFKDMKPFHEHYEDDKVSIHKFNISGGKGKRSVSVYCGDAGAKLMYDSITKDLEKLLTEEWKKQYEY